MTCVRYHVGFTGVGDRDEQMHENWIGVLASSRRGGQVKGKRMQNASAGRTYENWIGCMSRRGGA
jgi:hypothetical protein